MVFLYLFTLISLIIPLRPTYSDLEQRNLTKFPTPTLATLSNGAFFEGVNTWFADTFPFREQFLKLETGVTSLYGVKTSQVVGDVKQGDDIPDAPMTPDDSDSSADASGDVSSAGGTSSSGDASTSTPADSSQTSPRMTTVTLRSQSWIRTPNPKPWAPYWSLMTQPMNTSISIRKPPTAISR